MIVISDPFLLPVLALIWSMDTWLWLAIIRLASTRIGVGPLREFGQAIAGITDPPMRLTGRWIGLLARKSVPLWLCWLTTFVIVATVRHIMLVLLISCGSP